MVVKVGHIYKGIALRVYRKVIRIENTDVTYLLALDPKDGWMKEWTTGIKTFKRCSIAVSRIKAILIFGEDYKT